MGRKKTKAAAAAPVEAESLLREETKHGVLAIVFFALGLFFLLAGFHRSGLAGDVVYEALDGLFGIGFFLVPVLLFLISISFLKANRPHFLRSRLIGGSLFFLASLGIISMIVGVETGGLIGNLIAAPLLKLFELYVGLAFLIAIETIAILIMFDTHLTLEFRLFGWSPTWNKKAEETEEDDLPVVAIPQPAEEEEEEEPAPAPAAPRMKKEELAETVLDTVLSFGKKSKYDRFTPPPISLLEKDSGKPGVGDIKANSNIVKRTLANFGINVEMDEVAIGPSVTRYAFKPAEGVKLSRIVGLQNDLALALAAHPIRIEAPIPGKSLVGIEIPNTTKATIGLGSLLGSKEFTDSPLPLLVGLGKGVSGTSQYSNIAKAPHLLVAGATGSGKSVTIHTILTSLLYRNPPDRLRFLMIDPKRVELTLYNKIPHLLTPVITDAKKAIAALRWAAKEMDRRYDVLEKETVRDIQSYHKNVVEPAIAKAGKDGEVEIERMPYIVVVIDELADLMTAYPRELEASIVRLAQMSRAVGIHLILSTQRPSVEVITGLIKANVPSRIALQVASQIDSRTIIDMAGAEKLLGAGDMLYLSGEMSKPVRLQSAYISENEVKKVVTFLAEQYADELPSEINLGGEEGSNAIFSTALDGDEEEDDLYEDAREAVIQANKASASYLQRKLKVGYARAARLLDMLEERGVIGPGEGAKPREVYHAAPSGDEEHGA